MEREALLMFERFSEAISFTKGGYVDVDCRPCMDGLTQRSLPFLQYLEFKSREIKPESPGILREY